MANESSIGWVFLPLFHSTLNRKYRIHAKKQKNNISITTCAMGFFLFISAINLLMEKKIIASNAGMRN